MLKRLDVCKALPDLAPYLSSILPHTRQMHVNHPNITTVNHTRPGQVIRGDQMIGPSGKLSRHFGPPVAREAGTAPPRWGGETLAQCHAPTSWRLIVVVQSPRAIFGTTSSIFDLWSRPWGVVRLLGLRGLIPRKRSGSNTTRSDQDIEMTKTKPIKI